MPEKLSVKYKNRTVYRSIEDGKRVYRFSDNRKLSDKQREAVIADIRSAAAKAAWKTRRTARLAELRADGKLTNRAISKRLQEGRGQRAVRYDVTHNKPAALTARGKKDPLMAAWYGNPAKYDVRGVDAEPYLNPVQVRFGRNEYSVGAAQAGKLFRVPKKKAAPKKKAPPKAAPKTKKKKQPKKKEQAKKKAPPKTAPKKKKELKKKEPKKKEQPKKKVPVSPKASAVPDMNVLETVSMDGDRVSLVFRQPAVDIARLIADGQYDIGAVIKRAAEKLDRKRFNSYFLQFNQFNDKSPYLAAVLEGTNLGTIVRPADRAAYQNWLDNTQIEANEAVLTTTPGGTEIVVPVKEKGWNVYANIRKFLDDASKAQRMRVFELAFSEALLIGPATISTHGEGVSYLHVRIEQNPRYVEPFFQ